MRPYNPFFNVSLQVQDNAYIEYIKEMRKDSGHVNLEISNQDLLRLLTADKIL